MLLFLLTTQWWRVSGVKFIIFHIFSGDTPGLDCRQVSPVPVPSSLKCLYIVVLFCEVGKWMDVLGKMWFENLSVLFSVTATYNSTLFNLSHIYYNIYCLWSMYVKLKAHGPSLAHPFISSGLWEPLKRQSYISYVDDL